VKYDLVRPTAEATTLQAVRLGQVWTEKRRSQLSSAEIRQICPGSRRPRITIVSFDRGAHRGVDLISAS
jgi:hypothetical protein